MTGGKERSDAGDDDVDDGSSCSSHLTVKNFPVKYENLSERVGYIHIRSFARPFVRS